MTTGVIPGSVDSPSAFLSLGRGTHLPTQRQTSYRSASSSPSAHHPSSGFDVDNEIGQYFCNYKPLNAQDADGLRGHEHVG